MVEIDEYFRAVKLKTRLLLQIHDELLFEVPLVEVDLIKVCNIVLYYPSQVRSCRQL